ncbi:DUF7010 family protein [Alkalihalobacterium sp. APHAB7]|uniref:DUF7010 family protein n=1 Tax=Alkalihalobacterium sp. APHAB7 TaxID=3402081 RepID=UPI003AB037CD
MLKNMHFPQGMHVFLLNCTDRNRGLLFAKYLSNRGKAIFFAIITGAHFYPYGWFYNAEPFYIMAPIVSVVIMLLGFYLNGNDLWLITLSMTVLLLFLVFWLVLDYKRKSKIK